MAASCEEFRAPVAPKPKCFIFMGFIPDEAKDVAPIMIPCRILKSAGLLRALDFRPTEHGRQTISGVRVARTEAGEEPGAFNGKSSCTPVCLILPYPHVTEPTRCDGYQKHARHPP